ncbi:hypothetical protein AeNC1_006613 [Aphanomyces euteiches]|nr:hypothetical protein AeNC1_006613 [Aphanomyces euteiches]
MIKSFQSMGSSSWADDDELDEQPTAYAKPAAPIHEEHVIEEEPREEQAPPPSRGNSRYNDEYEGGRGGRGRRNSGEYHEKREKLPVPEVGPFKSYVGNLPYSISEDELAEFFAGCNVTDVRIPIDYHSNRPKGFAYMEFADRDSLIHALEFDGKKINQRAIRVDVAGEKKGGRQDSAFFQKRDNYAREDRHQRDDRYQREDRYHREDRRDDRRAEHDQSGHQDEAPVERRKLALAPRSKSKDETDAPASRPSNIFGNAKPRDERNVKPVADRPRQEAPKDQREQGNRRGDKRGDKGGRGDGKQSRADGDWGRGNAAASAAPQEKKAPKAKAAKAEREPAKAAVFKPAPTTTKTVNAFSALGGDDSDSD